MSVLATYTGSYGAHYQLDQFESNFAASLDNPEKKMVYNLRVKIDL